MARSTWRSAEGGSRWPLALAALAACGGDRSPPPPPAPTTIASIDAGDAGASDAAPPSYRVALQRGRALAQAGDWRRAIDAFEGAVAADPDDARARSELGWAALHAGDLTLAAQASEAASARATGQVKAAALYNLGRVHEARGDRAAAAGAYRASLALRASKTVATRLAELEAGGAVAPVVVAPVAVAPVVVAPAAPRADAAARFADVRAYCAAIAASDDEDAGAVTCVEPVPLAAGVDRIALTGPIRAVRVLGVLGDLDDVTCALWFDTGAGGRVAGEVPCRTTTAVGTDWAAVTALESPAPGRVIARFALGTALRDADDPRAPRFACQEIVLACRVDDGGARCTPAAPIAWAATCSQPAPGAAPAIAWDERAPWQLTGDHLLVRPARARPAPEGTVELTALDLPLAP
ncbi:MAG: tetratricopeptide repeat protein [Deltaproteobacteria bacterium]|nr:tetratricopeptide repeat protein [Deltaproteobacteria bacterium]